MSPETSNMIRSIPVEKTQSTFSFPPLRLKIEELKDNGKIKFRRLCFQFVHKGGHLVLVAYKMDKKRRWMDLDESFEKKKEGEIISNFKTMQRLIMLEPDPDSKAVVLTYGEDDELMFPQLELSSKQIRRIIKKNKDGYIHFKPKPGVLNPDYVCYDVSTTDTANPCPPAPPPDSGTATPS